MLLCVHLRNTFMVQGKNALKVIECYFSLW